MNSLRSIYSLSTIIRPIGRTEAIAGVRTRHYSNKSVNDQKNDWMDAEDGGYVQEAIRSVSEETINVPSEGTVQLMGEDGTTEGTPRIVSHENIRKDWMSTDEDSRYTNEAIHAASNETVNVPSGAYVQSIYTQSVQPAEIKSTSVPKPGKHDWLEGDDTSFADEAIRAVKNDTLNVPGKANVQKASGDPK